MKAEAKRPSGRTDCTANVVTVLYNSVETLPAFITALVEQADCIGELILVDNGSRDGTAALAETLTRNLPFRVVLIRNSNEGFALGYLQGERKIEDNSLATLCLNPDVILESSTLSRLLGALDADPRVGIATAPLVLDDGTPDPASIRSHPTLIGSSLYALLGKLTPKALRYNDHARGGARDQARRVGDIDATTGALMLVSPAFRRAGDGIFDTDYWMYGEDLQLCLDAANEGFLVRMVDAPASTHLKGASSGLPRRLRANLAFHDALFTYFSKNLARTRFSRSLVWFAVKARLTVSVVTSTAVRATRHLRRKTRLES